MTNRSAPSTERDEVRDLLRIAGRRPVPPEAHVRRARSAAHAEWQRLVRRRRRTAVWTLSGVAALAVASFLLSLRSSPLPVSRPAPPGSAPVAVLRQATGPVIAATGGAGARLPLHPPHPLSAGDRVETSGTSRAALELTGGTRVLVERHTALEFEGPARIRLLHGAVYVDAAPGSRDEDLLIIAASASVRHLGTQFEVRSDGASLRISVREGLVAVETTTERLTAAAGQGLVLTPGRPAERVVVPTSAPIWAWVADLKEPFELEGANIRSFLAWAAREGGWRVEYEPPSLRQRAEPIVLHGSIDGLTPAEALDAVLPASGLTHRVEEDRLIVGGQ